MDTITNADLTKLNIFSMELILTSIIAFVSTNIDDIFILMLLFANRNYQSKAVVFGQYLGIIVLIAISFLGSLLGLLIDPPFIGLLGLLPIFLGVRGIIELIRQTDKNEGAVVVGDDKPSNKMLSVAALTIANGGDNIGIYIPLFATLTVVEKSIMAFIFLLMVGVWCVVAKYLSRHPLVANTIEKYGHIITPFVLIVLGLYILYESGSIQLLL